MRRFVINLKRRPDRLALFRSRCPVENVEVIYAFDGKNPDQESPEEHELFKTLITLNPGERGCFVSHIRIFRKMVEEQIPVAQVFEDDCQFSPMFEKIMKEVQFPKQFMILYNGGRFEQHFTMPVGTHKKVSEHVALHTFENGVNRMNHDRTTHAYIITLNGAKVLLQALKEARVVEPVDEWLWHALYERKMPICSTVPLVCHSPWVGDSDIR